MGEYQGFPSKIFCLTVPKISVGESFTVALVFGEEGGYQKITSKIFCLTVPTKISAGESFTVASISGIEKVWRRGGGYQDFPSKIFCLTVPTKISVGESFIVALISGIEKVWRRGGGGVSRFSVENFLSHSAENFRRGILYSCISFFGRGAIKFLRRKIFVSRCRKIP